MITFNSLVTDFKINQQYLFREWIKEIIHSEGRTPGDIQYVFCDDLYLLEINKSFLNHDYFTDVITFPSNSTEALVSGEIYLSIDRVKDNAIKQQQLFSKELSRVMAHGLLHLIGYHDLTSEEKQMMTLKEDYYLNLQAQKIS